MLFQGPKKMTTWSRCTITNCCLTVDRIVSIVGWNTLGAIFRPNGIRNSLYSRWCHINVFFVLVLVLDPDLSIPIAESNVENMKTLPNESWHASFAGLGRFSWRSRRSALCSRYGRVVTRPSSGKLGSAVQTTTLRALWRSSGAFGWFRPSRTRLL